MMNYIQPTPGCWLWNGSVDTHGYGRLWIGDRHLGAHRAVYEYYIGPIPKGLGLLHRCDNPRCVAPIHLIPGDQRANLQDASHKGRIALGQRHGMATLTDEEGKQIRDLANSGLFTQSQIAKWYGIARPSVSQIKTGARRSRV